MLRTFPSRIDKICHILIFFLLIVILVLFWLKIIVPACIILVIELFLIQSLLSTEYIINNDTLYLHSGLLPIKHINIADIVEIKKVKSWTPAYALSSRRISIRTDSVILQISPEEIETFVSELKKVNERI